MNINLDDKKIKKIVYAIDDISELDIFFENGEISSLNRRFRSAMKPDTFLSSMIDGSKKLGKAIVEENKKHSKKIEKDDDEAKRVKTSMSNLFTARKLIDMDKDGTLDDIVKAHCNYDTSPYKITSEYDDLFLDKCEQESNNGEETEKKFEASLDKLNMDDNLRPIVNKLMLDGKYERDKTASEPKNETLEIKPHTTEELSKLRDEIYKLTENKEVMDKIKVLTKLDELGYYDLGSEDRKERRKDYIDKAIENIWRENSKTKKS